MMLMVSLLSLSANENEVTSLYRKDAQFRSQEEFCFGLCDWNSSTF